MKIPYPEDIFKQAYLKYVLCSLYYSKDMNKVKAKYGEKLFNSCVFTEDFDFLLLWQNYESFHASNLNFSKSCSCTVQFGDFEMCDNCIARDYFDGIDLPW